MRVTKYEHATLRVEKDGAALLIDPGLFTRPVPTDNVVAVVITHEHPDHWTRQQLDAILEANPGTPIFAPEGVARAVAKGVRHDQPADWTPGHWTLEQLDAALGSDPALSRAGAGSAPSEYDITVVAAGDELTVGPFSLRFFGGSHEQIHSSIAIVDNVGVLVDDALYYPGDSYAVPEGVLVDTLAAPIAAPWLKIGDAMDFVRAVAARRTFGTHEQSSSPIGIHLAGARMQWAAEDAGGSFVVLEPGDSIEV